MTILMLHHTWPIQHEPGLLHHTIIRQTTHHDLKKHSMVAVSSTRRRSVRLPKSSPEDSTLKQGRANIRTIDNALATRAVRMEAACNAGSPNHMYRLHGRINPRAGETRISCLTSFASDISIRTSINDGQFTIAAGALP